MREQIPFAKEVNSSSSFVQRHALITRSFQCAQQRKRSTHLDRTQKCIPLMSKSLGRVPFPSKPGLQRLLTYHITLFCTQFRPNDSPKRGTCRLRDVVLYTFYTFPISTPVFVHPLKHIRTDTLNKLIDIECPSLTFGTA